MPTSTAKVSPEAYLPLSTPSPRESPRPFLKWAGGKGRLLTQLLPMLPHGVEHLRHVEPFAGGAAMYFARRPPRALLSDCNAALIRTFEAVRDHVDHVIDRLRDLSERHQPQHYYRVRARYNAHRETLSLADHAAYFIYLNKTCFNGLHRVNRKGEFNVPIGRYRNPAIADEATLRAASSSLAGATLMHNNFEHLLQSARPGDFIYMDPPYQPLSTTANFTSYDRGGFSPDDQARLSDVFAVLDRRGCRLMLSNSDVPLIRHLYRHFRLNTVLAPRAINSNAAARGHIAEIVVRNY